MSFEKFWEGYDKYGVYMRMVASSLIDHQWFITFKTKYLLLGLQSFVILGCQLQDFKLVFAQYYKIGLSTFITWTFSWACACWYSPRLRASWWIAVWIWGIEYPSLVNTHRVLTQWSSGWQGNFGWSQFKTRTIIQLVGAWCLRIIIYSIVVAEIVVHTLHSVFLSFDFLTGLVFLVLIAYRLHLIYSFFQPIMSLPQHWEQDIFTVWTSMKATSIPSKKFWSILNVSIPIDSHSYARLQSSLQKVGLPHDIENLVLMYVHPLGPVKKVCEFWVQTEKGPEPKYIIDTAEGFVTLSINKKLNAYDSCLKVRNLCKKYHWNVRTEIPAPFTHQQKEISTYIGECVF